MSVEPNAQGESNLAEDWVYLCDVSQLSALEGLRVEIPGRPALAVFRVDQTCYVIDDTCTHGSASLAEGYLQGHEIECPFHAGRFDIRTGAATAYPCLDAVAAYPVEVRANAVYARLVANPIVP
jgi:nitrite reductase/ring-hydroxylating ferredoxin subunit